MIRISFYLLIICLSFAKTLFAEDNIFSTTKYDRIYGKDDAPIQVLEYYSLTCPHCSYFYLSHFADLKKEYIDTGKVKWIKRSYSVDLQSLKATMFLSCIPKDRYESYLKILLSKQSSWAYQQDFLSVLQNIASLGGMSKGDFYNCVNDIQKEKDLTKLNDQAKEKLHISGTPAFFVNQQKLDVYSEKSFHEAFQKLLK